MPATATTETITLGLIAYRATGPDRRVYLDKQSAFRPGRTGVYETCWPADAQVFRDAAEFTEFTEKLRAANESRHRQFVDAGWRLATARLSVDFEGEAGA